MHYGESYFPNYLSFIIRNYISAETKVGGGPYQNSMCTYMYSLNKRTHYIFLEGHVIAT